MEKRVFSTSAGKAKQLHVNQIEHSLLAYAKISSKWFKGLTVGHCRTLILWSKQSSCNLDILVLGACAEETNPVACQWDNHWHRQKGWRSLNSTHEECMCAGLPTVRVEKVLHYGLPPHCCTPQSKQGKHPGCTQLYTKVVTALLD